MEEEKTKCEKCGREYPEYQVKRRTFWPKRTDVAPGGKVPKWIKTQSELCPDCYEGMKKALQGVI